MTLLWNQVQLLLNNVHVAQWSCTGIRVTHALYIHIDNKLRLELNWFGLMMTHVFQYILTVLATRLKHNYSLTISNFQAPGLLWWPMNKSFGQVSRCKSPECSILYPSFIAWVLIISIYIRLHLTTTVLSAALSAGTVMTTKSSHPSFQVCFFNY